MFQEVTLNIITQTIVWILQHQDKHDTEIHSFIHTALEASSEFSSPLLVTTNS